MRGPCPACGTALREIVHKSNVELDTCDGCGGLYFDAGEYESAMRLPEATLSQRLSVDPNEAFTCPGCAQPMRIAPVEGVVMHVCAQCRGVFGSMEALATLKSRQADLPTPAPSRKAAKTPPQEAEWVHHSVSDEVVTWGVFIAFEVVLSALFS